MSKNDEEMIMYYQIIRKANWKKNTKNPNYLYMKGIL